MSARPPPRERLTLSGTLTKGVCVVRDVGRRDVAQQGRGGVREGAKEPIILVRTALTLAALHISAISGASVAIALTIRALPQHGGLGDSQWTTTLALLRFVPLACGAWCVGRRALLEPLAAGGLPGTAARGALPEAPLSVQRVRRAVWAWAARQRIFAHATPGAAMAQIERAHEPLLHMLMYTGDAPGQPWLQTNEFLPNYRWEGKRWTGASPANCMTLLGLQRALAMRILSLT